MRSLSDGDVVSILMSRAVWDTLGIGTPLIGIAGGEKKLDIIRAALRGQILDVPITDHAVAQARLDGAVAG